MGRLATALRVIRAPFFTATIVSVLVGAAVAWYEGVLHPGYLLITLLAALFVHAGLNLSNDYYDHDAGPDALNDEFNAFSGGSRSIQDGVLTPRGMLGLFILSYAVGGAIGVYLAAARGWWLLAIWALGMFLCLTHNGPPLRVYYLIAAGPELAIGLGFGPILVLASYYVQAQRLSLAAAWASLAPGLFMAALLCANEFPDYTADRRVGKKTLPVLLGRERAVGAYVALLLAGYAATVAGIVAGLLPAALGISLLTLPLALRAVGGMRRFHSDPPALAPTNAATYRVHFYSGLLMTLGYVIARVWG